MMNLRPGWVGSLVRDKTAVGSKGELGLVSSPEENGPSWLAGWLGGWDARGLASSQQAASDDAAAVAQLHSHQPSPYNTVHSISHFYSYPLFLGLNLLLDLNICRLVLRKQPQDDDAKDDDAVGA